MRFICNLPSAEICRVSGCENYSKECSRNRFYKIPGGKKEFHNILNYI